MIKLKKNITVLLRNVKIILLNKKIIFPIVFMDGFEKSFILKGQYDVVHSKISEFQVPVQ